MDWIIKSKDEISGRIGENRYQNEAGFRTALTDVFNNPKKEFICAGLPDGSALDDASAKALVNFTIGVSGIGTSSIA